MIITKIWQHTYAAINQTRWRWERNTNYEWGWTGSEEAKVTSHSRLSSKMLPSCWCFVPCLHAQFNLKGFLFLLFNWRERRKMTCRHRFLFPPLSLWLSPARPLARRSMLTLGWLSSVFRRILYRSPLVFTHYLSFCLFGLSSFLDDELYTLEQ